MVKKIKKYLKFVVCCALILSLVAPSYAALSASDGSAFVTKAEFDSALADFNARLTTFEAGINSKIDSQVTSYLDRNGIWNGLDWEWNECAVVYGSANRATVNSSAIWGFYTGSEFHNTWIPLGKANKSGMCCIDGWIRGMYLGPGFGSFGGSHTYCIIGLSSSKLKPSNNDDMVATYNVDYLYANGGASRTAPLPNELSETAATLTTLGGKNYYQFSCADGQNDGGWQHPFSMQGFVKKNIPYYIVQGPGINAYTYICLQQISVPYWSTAVNRLLTNSEYPSGLKITIY